MSYEPKADAWLAWTRTPGHDVYDDFSGPALLDVLPAPGRATLEIGCGEGRVARDLAAHGHRVTGLDVSPKLVAAAAEAHPEGAYVVGDAATLPFADGAFDLVVAFNSLTNVDDMPGALREAARVLEPGGRLGVCVPHPFADAGAFESLEPDAAFVIGGSFLGDRRRSYLEVERDGLTFTFEGWEYTVEAYSRALEAAGFLVEAIREPVPDLARFPERPSMARWLRVPLFLYLRAVKP